MARLRTTTCSSCGGPARLPPDAVVHGCTWCGVLLVDPLRPGGLRDRSLRLAVDNVAARLDAHTSEARRGLAAGSASRARAALSTRMERLIDLAREEGLGLEPATGMERWKAAVVAREIEALRRPWEPPLPVLRRLLRAADLRDADTVESAYRSLAEAWRASDPNWGRAPRQEWEELVERGLIEVQKRVKAHALATDQGSAGAPLSARSVAAGPPLERPPFTPASDPAGAEDLPGPTELPAPETVDELAPSRDPARGRRSRSRPATRPPSPASVALASLLVPGLGQVLLGQGDRGLKIFVVALLTLSGCGLVSAWAAWDAWTAAHRLIDAGPGGTVDADKLG